MKLRCGKLTNRKVNNMEKSEEVSVAGQIEKETNEAGTSHLDLSTTVSVTSLLRGIAKEINVMKQQLNERLDKINSELCEKIDGLKLDVNNSVSNFQKFVRTGTLDNVDNRISESLGSDASFRKPSESADDLLGSANKADLPEVASRSSFLSKIDTVGSLPADMVLATPKKGLSLPCISESPELNLKKSPSSVVAQTTVNRPILPFPSLMPARAVPVLTVASSMPLIMSPIAQPPIKFLRTIKPKPSTSEEVILSDFDSNAEDLVRPTSILSVDGERVRLPGSSRVRTRGGMRRGTPVISVYEKGEDIDIVPDKKASIRGSCRGAKSKLSSTVRRKSERLKKSDSDSPIKDEEQNLFAGDTPLEEYLWGEDNVVPPTTDYVQKTNDPSVPIKIPESNVRNEENRDMDSDMLGKLSRVDNACDDVLSAETNDNNSIKEQGKLQTDKETNILDHRKIRLKSEEDRNTNSSMNENISKETPRNLPFKKTLSLSSPRRRSHIRALDFATPIKALPPRKANTSPKAVSQVKLAQMRSLRRTNLFKSPAKKTKSWDADLRAFVEPDLPLSQSSGRKRQPNRTGRSAKFISPKKKIAIKMKGQRLKTPMKHKSIENREAANVQKNSPLKKSLPGNDGSPKSADELVKEIEKEVLEVISEDSKSKCNTDELIKDDRNNANDATESVKVNTNDLNESSSSETESSAHQEKAISSSHADSVTPAKILDKTPAKLDFSGLLSSQMMTPITKILNEQSTLLDNYNFLTPGFLPTPDSLNNSKSDVRKAATPSPSKKQAVKTPNSDQSISPVIECPIRIEEALAAEKEVVKPLQKASPKTPIKKSPEVSSKSTKKKPLTLGLKQNVQKNSKKKSIEELIITECLKNAEKDLFGTNDSLDKKSKISANAPKNMEKSVSKKQKPVKSGDDGKRKKEVPTPSKSGNAPTKCKSHVDIKLPTFEEMMTRLSKLNKLTSSSSSSSDSSGDEVKKGLNQDDDHSSKSTDSFPKLQVSPDESTTSLSGVNRLKILKPPPATINVKSKEKIIPKKVQKECVEKTEAPQEVTTDPIRGTTKKYIILNSENQELIKDFSYLSSCGSSLKDLSFEYYDEGKGGDRNIKPTQTIHLFQFPFSNTKFQEKSSSKSSKMSSEASVRKSASERDAKIECKPENKELNKSKSLDKSSDYVDKKSTSSKRFVRSGRSKSRESRLAGSVSKTSVRSHRSKHLIERGMTPIGRRHRRRSRERYTDTFYRQYKRDRVDEYRRKSSRGSKTRRSESPPNHSRSAKRNKENYSPNRSNSRDKHISRKKSELEKKMQDRKHEEKQFSEDQKARRLPSREDKSKQDHHRELDPRTRSKINDHNYKEMKPIAESTPCNKRSRLSIISPKEDSSEKSDRFLKESPEIRSPDSLKSDERWNHFSDPSRRLLKDNEREIEKDEDNLKISSQEDAIILTDPRINRSSTSFNKITTLPHHSSQQQDSPDSPPRDPRLLARNQRNLLNVSSTSSNTKRKLDEEREEGELSDDSSMSLQQITSDWKRRKLSVIHERDFD